MINKFVRKPLAGGKARSSIRPGPAPDYDPGTKRPSGVSPLWSGMCSTETLLRAEGPLLDPIRVGRSIFISACFVGRTNTGREFIHGGGIVPFADP